MTGWRIALIAVSALAACTATPRSDLPPFPQFDPDDGIKMAAGLFGRLVLVNGCLALVPPDGVDAGPPTYLIFHQDAVIDRDAHGIYLREEGSGSLIRVGEPVSGGGGFLSPALEASAGPERDAQRAWLNARVTPNLPSRCRGPYASFHSFRAWDGRTYPP